MTKITMIPHDGGPCPVDGDYIVRKRNKEVLLVRGDKDGHRIFLGGGFYLYWVWDGGRKFDNDIIAYCPIEIEDGVMK